MRTFRLAVAGSVASLLMLGSAAAGDLVFRSSDDAMKQGISAFNGGYYELALPAFEALEATKPQVARFYMARIYADSEGAYTDYGKAFRIFKALAVELQDVDPDDEELAPIAAKSLTAVSKFLREGNLSAGIQQDIEEANRDLQRAALTFDDQDAQFELAKVYLRGEGPDVMSGGDDPASKIENGRHWLSRLSQAGHPGAQAVLADLMWRGKFVKQNQAAALNLIDVAIANAQPSERVWIEDIYQNIFCNAGEGVRLQATGRVAEWHNRYGRRPELVESKDGLDDLTAEPVRTCQNGELVRPMSFFASDTKKPVAQPPQMISAPSAPQPPRSSFIPAGASTLQGRAVVPSSPSAVTPNGDTAR